MDCPLAAIAGSIRCKSVCHRISDPAASVYEAIVIDTMISRMKVPVDAAPALRPLHGSCAGHPGYHVTLPLQQQRWNGGKNILRIG